MSDQPNFLARLFTLRRLFLWGNFVLLAVFLLTFARDDKRGWKPLQKQFKTLEIERTKARLAAATTPEEKEAAAAEFKIAKKSPIEVRQIWAQDVKAVDRCITCHVGYDTLSNPNLTTPYKQQPFSAPADSASLAIHKAHDLEKFGCAVCHGGQGIATEVDAAHGRVEHWEQPLLEGTLLQASCAKCHDNLAELKINGQVYPSEIIRAKKIFHDLGCIGCHQLGGEGGPISVDLKEETSAKPLSRIDFNYSGLPHNERTLANWIKIHFVNDPASFVPGDPHAAFNTEPISPSAMPPYLLSEKDANALTAYILSLNRKDVPPQFLTLRAAEAEPVPTAPVAHGRYVYEKYGCAGCHGPEARGGIRNYNYQYDVTPNLRRAVATYTRETLKAKISEGVPFVARLDAGGPNPPLYMPAWKSKIKGEELEDLVTYLLSIKE